MELLNDLNMMVRFRQMSVWQLLRPIRQRRGLRGEREMAFQHSQLFQLDHRAMVRAVRLLRGDNTKHDECEYFDVVDAASLILCQLARHLDKIRALCDQVQA